MKRLSAANWLELDETITKLERLGSDAIDPSELAADFLAITLSPKVPREVRDQFERARAALVYGSLFYPLYSVGICEMARGALQALHARSPGADDDGQSTADMSGPEQAFWSQIPAMTTGDFVTTHELGPDEILDIAKRLAHAISSLHDPEIDFLAAWTRRK